jgi:hypothetical protein
MTCYILVGEGHQYRLDRECPLKFVRVAPDRTHSVTARQHGQACETEGSLLMSDTPSPTQPPEVPAPSPQPAHPGPEPSGVPPPSEPAGVPPSTPAEEPGVAEPAGVPGITPPELSSLRTG